MKPDCVTDDGYLSWLAADKVLPLKARSESGFCEDCTPEFQAAAKAAGKCSNPTIRFFKSVQTTGVYGALLPGRRVMLDSAPALSHFYLEDPEVVVDSPRTATLDPLK